MFLDRVSCLLGGLGGPRTVGAACVLAASLAVSPEANAQVLSRFALRLEGGVGTMLSDYQTNTDPTQFSGNLKAFNLGIQGTARLAFTIVDPIVLQLSFSNWWFTTETVNNLPATVQAPETGRVMAPMAGLRIEPRFGNVGRLFVDGNVGVAFTGDLNRLTFDVGLGFEFQLARWLHLGPVVRYGQVIQPDTDGDGVFDPDDQCPTQPMGEHPDPNRRGCPATDMDQDGVFDPDDQCPNDPMGPNPDPNRRGCPAPDTDHDGVIDPEDQCPNEHMTDHPNPERRGCPDGDRDNDTVYDHADQCPDEAQGATPDPARPGCPIADRDHDGIPDATDRCPERPENFNGVEDEDGCPDRGPDLAQLGGGQIRIFQQVNFATDSDRIVGRRSQQILDAVGTLLRLHGEIRALDIQGHTDDRGSADHNRELSLNRANAVRQALITRGIAEGRLQAHGFGPDRPLQQGTSRRARAANRRVEFHIVVNPAAEGVTAPAPSDTPAPAPTPAPDATAPQGGTGY